MIFISFSEAYARFDNKNHKFNYTFKKRWKNIFTTSQSDENRWYFNVYRGRLVQ